MAKVFLELETEDGKFERFSREKIKARKIKDAMKMQKKVLEATDEEAALDLMLDFVIDLFDDVRLTADKILDNMESELLLPTLEGIVNTVMGNDTSEGKQ